MKELPTQEYLLQCFKYSPETGLFYWNRRPREHFKTESAYKTWNTRFSGKSCCNPSRKGYLRAAIDGVHFYLHRLAYKIVHKIDAEQVDHIDGNKTNNRIGNLRDVSNQDNMKNLPLRTKNNSGAHGVGWSKQSKKWYAQIKANGKRKHLGFFVDIEDAISARKAAEIEYGYHGNHGRSKND